MGIVASGGLALDYGPALDAAATGSALKQVADSLSAGQWGEVTGHSGGDVLYDTLTGDSDSVFEFANRAVFDTQLGRWYFYGSSDPVGSRGFCSYYEANNSFQRETFPSWPFAGEDTSGAIEHSYDCNVIAPERREMFYHQMGSSSVSWKRYDLDTGVWTEPDGWTTTGNSAVGACWFPERGEYVAHNPTELRFYDPVGQSWSGPTSIANLTNQCGIAYSRTRPSGFNQPGCCVAYGSGGAPIRYNIDGTTTTLDSYPGTGTWDTDTAHTIMDPVSGKLLCFVCTPSTTTMQAWELDPSETTSNQWTRLNTGTYANVESGGIFTDTGQVFAHISFASSACEIPTHGVIMFVQVRNVGVRIFVYKHTDSVTMESLMDDADSFTIGGSTDTLTALDFETLDHGHASQETIQAGQGAGVQLTDTTDPSRFLRDHVNGANFIDTNPNPDVLFSGGLNFQGRYTPWVAEWSTPDETAGGTVAKGPQIVAGVGEFENITGTSGRSCLRLRTPDLCTQKASGDFVIAFRRLEGIGAAQPHNFLTAGQGAEIWFRVAMKHSNTFLTTTQAVTASTPSVKRFIISGDSSSQTLEETMNEGPDHAVNRVYAMYSNSGAEDYEPDPTEEFVEDWQIVHVQVVVADAPNYNNGQVRLYLNDETDPILEITNADMDTGGTLLSGWQYVDTSTAGTNQGYWKVWLTNFLTNKDATDTHADLDMWYDNVVIRRNTRCPHIRTG